MESEGPIHMSDCAVHNEPAFPKGECDCSLYPYHVFDRSDSVGSYVSGPGLGHGFFTGMPTSAIFAARWLNNAYAEGRKAERERCAQIAESNSVIGELIAEKIRGGQDGE